MAHSLRIVINQPYRKPISEQSRRIIEVGYDPDDLDSNTEDDNPDTEELPILTNKQDDYLRHRRQRPVDHLGTECRPCRLVSAAVANLFPAQHSALDPETLRRLKY
jgi:hypothetical protein